MKPIDLRGDFDSYLLDHKRIIPKSHLHSVCRFQNGNKTCRYIFMYKNKYLCVKNTTLKDMLDKLIEEGPKTAYKLAEAGVVSIDDLEKRVRSDWLVKKGFSEKNLQNILKNRDILNILKNRTQKSASLPGSEKTHICTTARDNPFGARLKGFWLSHCQPVHPSRTIKQKECVNIILKLPEVGSDGFMMTLVNLLLCQSRSSQPYFFSGRTTRHNNNYR